MTEADWYRNEAWDETIEKAFLENLTRARSQRDQYLKIQISYLARTQPRDALRLCKLFDDTRTDTSWDLSVRQCAAHAYEALGQISEAVTAYKEILEHDEDEPFFPNNVLLEAPLLIASKGDPANFSFAWETIERAREDLSQRDLRFATQTLMYHGAQAFLRLRANELEEARAQARIALDAAAISHSGLRYHRTAGLVGPEYDSIILKLKSITSGLPEWALKLAVRFEGLSLLSNKPR